MKRYFYLASAAIVIISACSKEPEEPAVAGPAIEVKTGAATIDETEVKLEGTYTYDGDQETEPGFRYGATQTEMLAAEIIPAEKVSGNAFMSSFLAENGEYYYQAVLTVGNEIFTGKTGWFEVSFSSVPEITTETADILQDGVMLNGTYRFDSKKIPIQVGFFYADNPDNLATVEFHPVTPEGNSFSFKLEGINEIYYQAAAIVNGVTYRGETLHAKVTDLSAEGPANCYIVTEEGWYSFDTKKTDGSTVSGTTAAWIWASEKEILSSISYSDGKIMFKASGEYGNETVALCDADGTIQWSWHIWSTDMPAEQEFEGTVMLDRNVGATTADANLPGSLGLYFQWGRKDPFVSANTIQKDEASAYEDVAFAFSGSGTYVWTAPFVYNGELVSGIMHVNEEMDETMSRENPANYYGTYNAGGWKDGNDIIGDYWGGLSGTKTNNDPCPAGYMVPTIDQTKSYIMGLVNSGSWVSATNSYGRIISYNGNTYQFPGSAFRAWSGKVRYPGRVTFLWSSTLTDTEKKARNFYDFKDNENSDFICNAMAVRCIKIK